MTYMLMGFQWPLFFSHNFFSFRKCIFSSKSPGYVLLFAPRGKKSKCSKYKTQEQKPWGWNRLWCKGNMIEIGNALKQKGMKKKFLNNIVTQLNPTLEVLNSCLLYGCLFPLHHCKENKKKEKLRRKKEYK